MQKNNEISTQSSRKYAKILNVAVDSTSTSSVLKFVTQKLAKKEKFYIVTPNPEIILEAQKDRELASALARASLAIPDGVGLVFAANFLGQPRLTLLPGRKVMLELLKLANQKRLKVFLLGSTQIVIEKCLSRMKNEFPRLSIQGLSGPLLNKKGEPVSERDIVKEKDAVNKMNRFFPDILFIAFGAPKQERWITKWFPKLKIGGAMVLGGALDYYAGVAKLPPSWMEKIGLEWLWRLVTEPGRAIRILNAAIIFPLRVLWEKLHA